MSINELDTQLVIVGIYVWNVILITALLIYAAYTDWTTRRVWRGCWRGIAVLGAANLALTWRPEYVPQLALALGFAGVAWFCWWKFDSQRSADPRMLAALALAFPAGLFARPLFGGVFVVSLFLWASLLSLAYAFLTRPALATARARMHHLLTVDTPFVSALLPAFPLAATVG